MGAWIEMVFQGGKVTQYRVAPHMGAWIEIFLSQMLHEVR